MIVFNAIGAIEVALIGPVKASLERLATEMPLPGFEEVVARKLAADLVEQVHAIPKRVRTLRGLDAAVILNVGARVKCGDRYRNFEHARG